ncbi:MAG: flagellar basal body rod protein FlgB [bacterium]
MADSLLGKPIDRIIQALDWSVTRQKLISSNLANRDTPGYRARDLDFGSLLDRARSGQGEVGLERRHSAHLPAATAGGEPDVVVKKSEVRADGNTVSLSEEAAHLVENGYLYQALLRAVGYKLQTLKRAIQGG